MEPEKTELQIVVQESGLEPSKAQIMLSQFTDFFEQAKQWEIKAREIVVTDVSQVEVMAQAKEGQKVLRDIRINAEKVRKELKENSLREGKAIDGVANVIKALVAPIEEYLESQAKFADNIREKELNDLEQSRKDELSKYTNDVSVYNLREMTEETFAVILTNTKTIWEAEQAKLKEAEDARIKAEEEKKREDERIRLENETLKKEKEERDAKLAEETKAREEAEKKLQEQKDNEAKAEAQRIAEEKAKKQQRLDEEKAKEDARLKAEADIAEQERQAKLAPDNEKLSNFANALALVEVPEVASDEAKETLKQALKILSQALLTLRVR